MVVQPAKVPFLLSAEKQPTPSNFFCHPYTQCRLPEGCQNNPAGGLLKVTGAPYKQLIKVMQNSSWKRNTKQTF